ncbi:MAG: hypothetical protein V4808_01685 [Pseudomonadota bacterium]
MTHEPPVPDANKSPYPIDELPHPQVDLPPVAEASGTETTSLKQRAEEVIETVSDLATENRSIASIGAAIALGAVATVAAILFARRSPTKPTPAQRKRPAAKPRARKPAANKAA